MQFRLSIGELRKDKFSPAEIHLDKAGQNLPEIFSLPTTIIGTVYNNDFNNTSKVSKTTEHLICN